MARDQRSTFILVAVIGAIIALIVFSTVSLDSFSEQEQLQVPYSKFLSDLDSGDIATAEISAKAITWTEKSAATRFRTERIPGVDDSALIAGLQKAGVEFKGKQDGGGMWTTLLAWLLPLGLLALILLPFLFFGPRRSAQNFEKSRARLVTGSKVKVNFSDVAGVDEAKIELQEVVDFLQHPEKYQRLGGKIPKGVLLLGAPGTGKTLLAKATAGEAGVPFFSVTGSQFVEMFVGVGAARVRDLFERAKQQAPSIVFIDEIDTIGKLRAGATFVGGHEEREQTLNQLLAEMDGFDPSAGVIIMAATNRPDVLDPALTRAGRFDRQITVERPDLPGREAILRVHVRGVALDASVDLHALAAATSGLVGADLANIVNEGALLAARRGADKVQMADFEAAIERVMAGLTRHSTVMSDEEKMLIAYHETGHAIVASMLKRVDPVHKVSIVPHGAATLGMTMQLPLQDRYVFTQEDLEDRLTGLLGGRAAEEVVFHTQSTGAHDDLVKATALARRMVCDFGMSRKVGPVVYERPDALRYLPSPGMGLAARTSESAAQLIDQEVHDLVERCLARAQHILETCVDVLHELSRELKAKEVLTGDVVRQRLAQAGGRPGADARTKAQAAPAAETPG